MNQPTGPHPEPTAPSPRVLRLLDAGVQMEIGDPQDNTLTFLERTLCQFALPYRNPGNDTYIWTRRNGRFELTVQPEIVAGKPVWAYGVIPRLALMWITDQVIKDTSAVDADNHTVYFNDSLRGFFDDLGLTYGGKRATTVRRQLEALAGTRLTLRETVTQDDIEGVRLMNALIADGAELLWSRNDPASTQPLLAQSRIVLSEPFWNSIKAHPVPLERQVIAALRVTGGGGVALDTFAWLKYRCYAAQVRHERSPIRIPWPALAEQFGSGYSRMRAFRTHFIQQLDAVQTAWPGFRYDARPEALLIWPRPRELN